MTEEKKDTKIQRLSLAIKNVPIHFQIFTNNFKSICNTLLFCQNHYFSHVTHAMCPVAQTMWNLLYDKVVRSAQKTRVPRPHCHFGVPGDHFYASAMKHLGIGMSVCRLISTQISKKFQKRSMHREKILFDIRLRRRPENEVDLKIEDNLKNEDGLKNEEYLQNEGNIENEDNLKNKDDLKMKMTLK